MTRKYFSHRKNGAPAISTEDFAYRFYNIFAGFVRDGYFERLNMRIRGGDFASDELMRKLAVAFGRESHNMFPTESNLLNMDRDSIFDLIEFLSEYVLEPFRTGAFIHPNPAARAKNGLRKWRKAVNEYLEQLDPPYNLTTNKEIEIVPPSAGLRRLVDNHASPSRDAQKKVDHACRLFLKRNATELDRRSALKELADVLEPLRDGLTTNIGKKQADKLFDIANNYGIRHNDERQKELGENYTHWFFYSALATIDLMGRLGGRQQDAAKPQA